LIKHSPAAKLTIDLKFLAVFFATQGNTLEVFEAPKALLDAGAGLVEGFGEDGGLVFLIGLVGDYRCDAARPCGGTVGLAGIAFVADCRARFDVRTDVQKDLETGRVRRCTIGQVDGNDVSRTVGFGMDLGREPAARPTESLALLPPFAPAAETCARTMVESYIWIR
jgi:hypothetical protein